MDASINAAPSPNTAPTADQFSRTKAIETAPNTKTNDATVAIHAVATRSIADGQFRAKRIVDSTTIQANAIEQIAANAMCVLIGKGAGSVAHNDNTNASTKLTSTNNSR